MVAPVPMLTPADSARAVGAVYTVSMLALLPIAAAAASAFALRRARAEGRVLVWRAAIVLLLSMVIARPFVTQTMAWVVPAALATLFRDEESLREEIEMERRVGPVASASH